MSQGAQNYEVHIVLPELAFRSTEFRVPENLIFPALFHLLLFPLVYHFHFKHLIQFLDIF